MMLAITKLIKLISLALLCLDMLVLCDTSVHYKYHRIEKQKIIRSKDIQQMTDIAKPIIDERYKELATVFNDTANITEATQSNLIMNGIYQKNSSKQPYSHRC